MCIFEHQMTSKETRYQDIKHYTHWMACEYVLHHQYGEAS